MLKIHHSLKELNFGKLMQVYEEGNRENAQQQYPAMDENLGVLHAEQDFYAYLRDCFFATEGSWYAVWEENERYICALRMEPYRDGFLLAALETASAYRSMGYAKKLINMVVRLQDRPIYSHVSKRNPASLHVHLACGFEVIEDRAQYVDGSVSFGAYTLCRKLWQA